MHGLIHTYGLWALFTVVMLECMGIPMPGETALVTAALYAESTHRIGIASVVLVAATAAIIGDNIGYLIGRSIGVRLIARYGKYVRLNELRLKVGQYLFLRQDRILWAVCCRSSDLFRSPRRWQYCNLAYHPICYARASLKTAGRDHEIEL